MNDDELRVWLLTQFTDLATAKVFMWRYVNEMDQKLPDGSLISTRSLAAHVSSALEGVEVPGVADCTNYLATKYGPTLYHAAWTDPENPYK